MAFAKSGLVLLMVSTWTVVLEKSLTEGEILRNTPSIMPEPRTAKVTVIGATPVPVSTLRPTKTSVSASTLHPTRTSVPVSTLRPTATPVPTSSLRPAVTPVPASSLWPTRTSVPVSTLRPTTTPVPASSLRPTRTSVPASSLRPTTAPALASSLRPTRTSVPASTLRPTRTSVHVSTLQPSSMINTANVTVIGSTSYTSTPTLHPTASTEPSTETTSPTPGVPGNIQNFFFIKCINCAVLSQVNVNDAPKGKALPEKPSSLQVDSNVLKKMLPPLYH